MRRLRKHGPPDWNVPPVHAVAGDPRYPSPHVLRTVIGVVLDLVVHLGLGAGAAVAAYRATTGSDPVPTSVVVGLIVTVAVSLIDRVFVQALTGTTSGKAIAGICTIRDDTGGWPTPWSLTRRWLAGVVRPIAVVLDLLSWP